jgi:putative flippase GtrA
MADSRGAGGPLAGAVNRIRHLVPELAKFGVVGAIGSVVDLGGSAFLYGSVHVGPLTAKAIAITAACVVTYLGSRFWTFRHRENQPLARELGLFIALNVIGLVIAEAVIALTAYAFGNKEQLAYNLASVAGTGLGTIFRYFAYRKWVFLAPASSPLALEPFLPEGPATAPAPPAARGGHYPQPAVAGSRAPHPNGSPPYGAPPWDLQPAGAAPDGISPSGWGGTGVAYAPRPASAGGPGDANAASGPGAPPPDAPPPAAGPAPALPAPALPAQAAARPSGRHRKPR